MELTFREIRRQHNHPSVRASFSQAANFDRTTTSTTPGSGDQNVLGSGERPGTRTVAGVFVNTHYSKLLANLTAAGSGHEDGSSEATELETVFVDEVAAFLGFVRLHPDKDVDSLSLAWFRGEDDGTEDDDWPSGVKQQEKDNMGGDAGDLSGAK